MPLHAAANVSAVALITPPEREHDAVSLLHRIMAHWPAQTPRPSPQLVPLQPASLQHPPIAEPEAQWRAFAAAVIVPSPSTTKAMLDRIATELHDSLTPCLVLAEHPGQALLQMRSANLLVMPTDENPALIAQCLAALIVRQPTVRSLQSQLRLAQSLEGGITAEIERINDELMLAAHVQREFLPKGLPSVPGLDAGVIFRPAGFVSGDIYDFTRLDEHHIGFYVADAMGHGLPAALMTLFIAAHLSFRRPTDTGYSIVSPGEAMSRLNAALYAARAGPSRFVSALGGVLDLRSGELVLSSAGHPAPLRVTRGGVERLDMSGMLLGILDDATFDEVRLTLRPGETILLHSDGVNSPTRDEPTAHLETPDAELCAPFLDRAASFEGPVASAPSMDEALSRVEATLDRRSGSFHQGDDITLLAIGVSRHADTTSLSTTPSPFSRAA